MSRYLTAPFAALVAGCLLAGCSASDKAPETAATQTASVSTPEPGLKKPKNTRSIGAGDLLRRLESAGLETKSLGAGTIEMDDLSRFPEEPRSTMVVRIYDGKGNSEAMTFVEFGSWKAAATIDSKPINGFAVRNWFVMGTVSNHFVGLVTDALSG